jgi:hypothetical protein
MHIAEGELRKRDASSINKPMEEKMLVAACEGHGFRYEVVDCNDGYLVRSRDLDSGYSSEGESKLFRAIIYLTQ